MLKLSDGMEAVLADSKLLAVSSHDYDDNALLYEVAIELALFRGLPSARRHAGQHFVDNFGDRKHRHIITFHRVIRSKA